MFVILPLPSESTIPEIVAVRAAIPDAEPFRTIGIVISAVSSSVLTFDTAYYDLEIMSGSIVTRLLQGTVKINKEVTR